MDAQAFPTPSRVDVADEQVVHQSDPAQGVVRTRMPDPQVQPTSWSCSWTNRPGVQGRVLLDHYDAFCAGAWPWRPPGAAVDVLVRYRQPPQVQWRTGARFSGSAVLELATAYD